MLGTHTKGSFMSGHKCDNIAKSKFLHAYSFSNKINKINEYVLKSSYTILIISLPGWLCPGTK